MTDHVLPDALAGERLDRVVAMLDGCSRSVAAALIAEGDVFVDGIVVRQRSVKLEAGTTLTFEPTADEEAAVLEPDATIEFDVVFADDHVVVIDKPPGLIVHPGAGRPDKTLVNGLLARYPDMAGVGQHDRPGIVHRLDGDTSGLLVTARTAEAYEVLVADLAHHDVERVYTAVVQGAVADDRGVIDAPIGRSTQRRTRMAVVADGREARTHYEVRNRRHDDPAATLLRCKLETGRTHQIRVHLAAIGHPVLGDPTYGTATSRKSFHRVALHAEELAFAHPDSDEPMRFVAPLADDIETLVDELGLGPV